MNYVKHILFPDEKVLYDGHVHPRVLLHGFVLLAISAGETLLTSNTGHWRSPILSFLYKSAENSAFMMKLYRMAFEWQMAAPDTAFEFKLLSIVFLVWGLAHFLKGILIMTNTELVVTDLRIIAKTGILNIMTLEMDRRRVAEVLIDQSFMGRIFNYGHIYIRGFTGVIGGMPVMVNPHLIERFLNVRY